LEKVGLWRARDLYPHQLSGGMRMRASLARALITEPDILLMDEPLSALDEVTREDLQDFIRELWLDRPFTAVFVTHSLREAVYLGRHLVIMSHDGGRILYDQPMPDSFTREGLRDSAAFQTAVADLSRRFRGSLRDQP
jgi:NitT/TauT family transport system ATP-binding protein